jgi:type II secretory pathway component PulL
LQPNHLLIFIPDAALDASPLRWCAMDDRTDSVTSHGECLLAEWMHTAEKNGLGALTTTLVLPESRVLCVRIRVPDVSASKIRELAPFAVEERLASEPEAQCVATSARETRGPLAGTVLAWCVERKWLAQTLVTLAKSVPPLAKILRAVPESALATGESRSASHAWQLLLFPARAVLVSPDGESHVSDVSNAQANSPVAFQLALNRLGNARPQQLILKTAPAVAPDIPEWTKSLAASVVVTPMFNHARSAPSIISTLATKPNLLTNDVLRAAGWRASQSGMSASASLLSGALLLTAIAMALHVVSTLIYAQVLKQQSHSVNREINSLFTQMFPQAQVVEPRLQTERNIAELKRVAGISTAGDLSNALAWLDTQNLAREPLYSINYASPVNGTPTVTIEVTGTQENALKLQQRLNDALNAESSQLSPVFRINVVARKS